MISNDVFIISLYETIMYEHDVLQEGAHTGDGGRDRCLSRFPSPLPERMVDKRPNVEWNRALIISLKDIMISNNGRSLNSARPGDELASVWRIYSNPKQEDVLLHQVPRLLPERMVYSQEGTSQSRRPKRRRLRAR
jgi:hypothetical protein